MTFVEYGSDGDRKVRRTQAAIDGAAEWRVSSTPVLTLAAAGAHPIALPVDALRLSNGTVVVADEGEPSLHWYDREGNHVLTSGRRGGGPGEFRSLGWISHWRGDSVVAHDGQLGRLSVFDAEGQFNRVISASEAPLGR